MKKFMKNNSWATLNEHERTENVGPKKKKSNLDAQESSNHFTINHSFINVLRVIFYPSPYNLMR